MGSSGTALISGGATSAPSFTNVTATDINGGNWKVFYTDGSGDVNELAVGAAGTFIAGNGTSSAPAFENVAATDINGGNWKVFYTDGSGDVTELALSATSGHVLTSNGASSAPSFQAAGGDMSDESTVLNIISFTAPKQIGPPQIAQGASGWSDGAWGYGVNWYNY